MKFSKIIYYFIITIFSLSICYIFVFKTELLTINKYLISGISPIATLIIKQLYDNMVGDVQTFYIHNNTFTILITILGALIGDYYGAVIGAFIGITLDKTFNYRVFTI